MTPSGNVAGFLIAEDRAPIMNSGRAKPRTTKGRHFGMDAAKAAC
jgi:hypothetical protein